MCKPFKLMLILTYFIVTAPVYAGENSGLRTVTTVGQGVAEAQADMAVVQMQASAVSKSATSAKSSVDQIISGALQGLDRLNIKKEDVVASTLRLTPEYQYDNRERIFTGYRATRDLVVTLKKLDALDSLLESMTTAGINNILSINLKSSKEEEIRASAFNLAIEDSKKKAGTLARAYGAELGNIHTITYRDGAPIIQEMSSGVMRASADQAGGEFIHDQIRFEDQIQVVFELIIPH